MDVTALAIPDIKLIRPVRHEDARGFFSEIYNRDRFVAAGIDAVFVQDNFSLSRPRGVLRGLHFQTPPFAQAKLVSVRRGAIFDVVVDIRHGSPWFGRPLAIELAAEDWTQLFIPEGFAHGFCTLRPDTEVSYKVNAPYSRDHDRGLLWNDAALGIDWPVAASAALLSEKDAVLPRLADLPRYFVYRDGDAA
jgi:dTDP-4-dehydrorhamnose 3,5-epimerase